MIGVLSMVTAKDIFLGTFPQNDHDLSSIMLNILLICYLSPSCLQIPKRGINTSRFRVLNTSCCSYRNLLRCAWKLSADVGGAARSWAALLVIATGPTVRGPKQSWIVVGSAAGVASPHGTKIRMVGWGGV